jgi:hypothetical protein
MCKVIHAIASRAALPSLDGFEDRPSSSMITGTGRTMVHQRLLMMDAMADKEDRVIQMLVSNTGIV